MALTPKQGGGELADITGLSRALGNVEGKLDLVIAALNKLDEDSATSRGLMRSDIVDMRTRLAGVVRVVEEIEPIVAQLRDDRLKLLGFMAAVGLFAGAIGAKIAAAAGKIFGG